MKTIKIEGYIVPTEDQEMYDFFGYSATSPKLMASQLLEAAGEDVELVIKSYGGDVWAAADIYAQLKRYEGATKASVTGLAASAATILMCGCDTVEAWPAAEIMIHLSHTNNREGDYRDMEEAAESLKASDAGLVAVYTAKTGKDPAIIQDLLEKTSWMTPDEALELGLIDAIVDPAERGSVPIAASWNGLPNVENMRAAYDAAKKAEPEPEQKKPNESDWQALADIEIENERFKI